MTDLTWRPGGGDSYSGGGGHGGGGGGGSGSIGAIIELIYYLIRLIIEVPYIGIPIALAILGYILYSAYKQHKNKDWDSGPAAAIERGIDLTELRTADPDFSQVVFEDFAYRLFSTAQRARATAAQLATVAPYVSEGARTALATRAPAGEPVQQVIVGAMRVSGFDIPEATAGPTRRARIHIQFEANVATAAHTYFTVESWVFMRDAERRSKPPSASKTFPCPNCGAPWQSTSTGTQTCASCGEVVDNGRFDWIVETISLQSTDERPPTLTTEVPERGTDLATYAQPDIVGNFTALSAADPAVTLDALEARLTMIYDQLNAAWSLGKLTPVRGLVSDGLYDYLQYWVDAYARQGLANRLVGMHVTRTQLAKIVRDKWFDAVTIRVWGSGKDFVVKAATDALVRGSRSRERPYSEYWTLIRSASRKGPPKPELVCGNCGAPLQITMAGVCTHCGAHVTAGEFDWVLSKIEQDDSYRG